MSSERHDLMRFDPVPGVKQQDGETLAFRVEIGIVGNVQAPVVSGFFRRVAKLQGFRCWTFAQRDDLVLVRLRVEFEGRHYMDHATTAQGTITT